MDSSRKVEKHPVADKETDGEVPQASIQKCHKNEYHS